MSCYARPCEAHFPFSTRPLREGVLQRQLGRRSYRTQHLLVSIPELRFPQEWDLNTGQQVRHLVSHGAQLSCIAVRPENAVYSESGSPLSIQPVNDEALDNVDAKSEGSDFDPLFDDEDENQKPGGLAMPAESSAPAPKHIPPVLDTQRWVTFSPDILMTASIDGQIVLWDKRVKTSGYDPFNGWQGVGRLYMSEKTRPWCMSVCNPAPNASPSSLLTLRRRPGPRTAIRSTLRVATGSWRYTTFGRRVRRGRRPGSGRRFAIRRARGTSPASWRSLTQSTSPGEGSFCGAHAGTVC